MNNPCDLVLPPRPTEAPEDLDMQLLLVRTALAGAIVERKPNLVLPSREVMAEHFGLRPATRPHRMATRALSPDRPG